MDRNQTHYIRSFFIGGLGFGLGGVVGHLLLYFLLRSRILSLPLNLIPEEQDLVTLLSVIVLLILGIALTTGIGSAIGGFVLSTIDPVYPRGKYLWRTAIAGGMTEGVLILPLILLTALIALYNNGLDREPTGQVILFAIYGVIFGIIFGLVFGLTTLGWRQFWRVLLGAMLGFGLGGAAIGYGIRIAYDPVSLGERLPDLLVLLPILSFMFFAVGGAILGIVYEWVSHWRVGNMPHEPARWVKFTGAFVAILIALSLISNYRQLVKFLTIQPGSLSSQLRMKTTGVHWGDPSTLSRNLEYLSNSGYSISTSGIGLANAVWIEGGEGTSEVVYSYQVMGEASDEYQWSEPVLISQSPGTNSIHPEIATDNNGINHIVWSEQSDAQGEVSDIYYSRCERGTCSPPATLSNLSGVTCANDDTVDLISLNDWPVIAKDNANTIMVMWSNSNNAMLYTTWGEGQNPPGSPSGCLSGPVIAGDSMNPFQPHVSGGDAGSFSAVFSVVQIGGETIYTTDYDGQNWSEPRSLANGTTPNVFADGDGKISYTWCDENEQVLIKNPDNPLVDTITFPPCKSRPTMAQDENRDLHLAWYSNKVSNNENVVSSANFIYESIRTERGWSEPAIVLQTEGPTIPMISGIGGGDLSILWSETGSNSLHTANQPIYFCSEDDLGQIGQVMLEVAQNETFRPVGDTIPYCRNKFIGFIYMPNPQAAYSPQEATLNGGFDTVADFASFTKYEVLFSVMEWASDEGEFGVNPGSVYTQQIAALYQQIRDDPSRYPRGLTIRILLGNYPEISKFEWGEQIWNVIDDLRKAGVDKMVDPEIGWKVEVANFEGTFPHSHTKFLVIDGRVAISAGFNYGYLHFPFDHPSGKGGDLFDLGIVLSGPIAQQVLTTYDDYWEGAEQLHCPEIHADSDYLWSRDCSWSTGQASHVPEVMKYSLTGGEDHAFSLNRNTNFHESDEIIISVLSSAEESLDIWEVNFSLELICALDLLNDDVCSYDNALDYMNAIMTAVEQNQAKVRILVEKVNSNGMENRVSAKEFTRELENRDLSEFVEIKFFEGRMHTKAFLVDEEMLFVGSQNFHYSAFGDGGLAEYNMATDNPQAIETFKTMFDYFWETGIPWDEYK